MIGGIPNGTPAALARRKRPTVLRSDERGGVAAMTGLLAIPLTGVAALAIDAGLWAANKAAMQGAADQAVLAAGLVMPAGAFAAAGEAKGVAAAHGFIHGANGVVVTANTPPAAGGNAVEVVIVQPQQRYFSGVLLASSPTASARAVAKPTQARACLVALTPTGYGIAGSGLGTIDAGTCNIHVNSTDACNIGLSGSIVVKGYDVFLGSPGPAACTSGTAGVSATHTLQYGAAAASDPYASRTIPVPSSTCTTLQPTMSATINLTPGTYCGDLALTGDRTVNLASGVYVFDGGGIKTSSANGTTINGTNVTLVFTSRTGTSYGGISASGILKLNLTAATTGPTRGMAIWIDKKGQAPLRASGSLQPNITGVVYAPGSDLSWSGNLNSTCTQLIVNRITFSGGANLRHDCANVPGIEGVGGGGYKLVE